MLRLCNRATQTREMANEQFERELERELQGGKLTS